MNIYAVFDANGLNPSFYNDDVYPPHSDGSRSAAIPAGAVQITAEQWQELIANPGRLQWSSDTLVPYTAPINLVALQATLCADIDAQAEAQRLRYVTGGASQAMVYLQKQTQAVQALVGAAATPPMTADAGAAAYGLLAATIGIDIDPSTKAPATDVFGVARGVVATVQQWLPLAAAIEKVKATAKAAITAAATAQAAQAAHDGVTWPAAV